jgi:uncharacterized protein (DUF697 family)
VTTHAATFTRVVAGGFDGATDDDKRRASRDVIQMASVAAAATAVQPIPGLDLALLVPIHVGMVQAIGRIHGYTLDGKAVIEMLSSFGAALVARSVLISTVKLLPFVGWIAAIPVAFAITHSIGECAHVYFASGRGVSKDEMRSMFERFYEKAKADKDAETKANASLKQRLTAVVAAYEAGVLSEEEFERKKKEILGGAP